MHRSSPSRFIERPRALGLLANDLRPDTLDRIGFRSMAVHSGCRRRRFFTRFVTRGVTLAMSLRLGVPVIRAMGPPKQSACCLPCCGERPTNITGPTTSYRAARHSVAPTARARRRTIGRLS
jgi:hypothetical protein